MLLYVEDDIQVPGGSTESSSLSVTGKANTGSILNTGWNLGLNCALPYLSTFSLALETRIRDHGSSALTSRACACNREEPLLVADLATTLARPTAYRRLSGSRSLPIAGLTSLMPADGDLRFRTKHCLLELKVQVFTVIGPALGTRATTPSCASK